MNITTRVTKLDNPESKLKALATIVLNGNFAVGGIKVIETEKGMYVAMPNHLGKDKQYYDDCYPVTAEMRKAINKVPCCPHLRRHILHRLAQTFSGCMP